MFRWLQVFLSNTNNLHTTIKCPSFLSNTTYPHNDQGVLTAPIPLNLSCYQFLSAIALGKSSRWYPVSAQS